MVPTLTILGRFSEAARGAVIPWLETTLVTVAIMAVLRAEVTSIPPRGFYPLFTIRTASIQSSCLPSKFFSVGNFLTCFPTHHRCR